MTECPEIPILIAYALGDELDDALPADIAAHVEGCAECSGFVADAANYPDITLNEGATPISEEEIAISGDALRLKTNGHQHISPRLLAAYCVGSLAPVSEGYVVEHMTDCTRCADAMQKLIDDAVPQGWVEGEGEFAERSGDDASTAASQERGGDADAEVLRLLTRIGADNWRSFLASEADELWSAEGDTKTEEE